MATKSRVDKHQAATILVYALYNTDEQTGKDFGVTRQTVINYRNRLQTDEELLQVFTDKRIEAEREWKESATDAMLSAISYIRRASLTGEVTPEMLHSVAGALKIISEVTATHKLIDLRIENARRVAIFGDTGQDHRALAPGTTIVLNGESK